MIGIAINFPSNFRKYHSLFLLCFIWLIGLISGAYFFHICRPYVFLQMRSLAQQPVSFICLFLFVYLPLFCTYVALLTNNFPLILFICFLKALAFSFTYFWTAVFFGSASWLANVFFMFSDRCSLLILFTLWLRYSDNLLFSSKYPFFLCTFLCFLIVAADYFIISPLLRGIF